MSRNGLPTQLWTPLLASQRSPPSTTNTGLAWDQKEDFQKTNCKTPCAINGIKALQARRFNEFNHSGVEKLEPDIAELPDWWEQDYIIYERINGQ